jgi:hypothetical protein
MPIRFKVHQQGPDTILAAADEAVLGLKHKGNGRVLDLQMFRSFYDGESADEARLASLLSSCTSANLVGEQTIAIAVRAGLVQREHVIDIGGVPHVQLYRMEPEKD